MVGRNAYKDDLEAAHERLRVLEQDNVALKKKLEAQTSQPRKRGWAVVLVTSFLILGVAAVFVLGSMGGARGALFAVAVMAVIALPAIILTRLLHTCRPNEALVLSGRAYRGLDGAQRGYRVVLGGRVIRLPFIESVDRFDLTLVRLSITLSGALAKDAERVNIEATAAVRVSTDPTLLANAIERFLGRERREIEQVARETIEGHLRSVVAFATVEELQDRLRVADNVIAEVTDDFNKLGLSMDVFKLQTIRPSA